MTMLRFEFANAVIPAIGAQSYLQIGSARYLDEIVCATKRSCHDAAEAPLGPFDVVFVDPPHDPGRASFALQVALERVSPTGVILVANVNPAEEWMQEVPASARVQLGQAWKAWLAFRASCGRYTYTADLDHGVGVMVAGSESDQFDARLVQVDFQTFAENRTGLLNMADPESVLLAVRALRSGAQHDPVIGAPSEAPLEPLPSQPEISAAPIEPEPVAAPAPTPRRKRRDRVAP